MSTFIDENDSKTAAVAWPLTLACATIVGTLATACMMPFVALAVTAAATMPTRRALLTVVAIWATNQIIGFTSLGFPATPYAFEWGAALGTAALAAMLVGRRVLIDRPATIFQHIAAFATAFLVYETGLFAFALIAGGVDTFTPVIVMRILLNEAGWFAALTLFHLALTRAAPRWFGASPHFA